MIVEENKEKRQVKSKVACPYCGYEMPVFFDEDARCTGLYIRCKGRGCRKEFEIKINVR